MAKSATVAKPEKVVVEPVWAVLVDRQTGTDPGEISHAMGAAFELIDEAIEDLHLTVSGPPRSIYTSYSSDGTTFTVAMPVARDGDIDVPDGPVRFGKLPGGSALRFSHHGPYRELTKTYDGVTHWLEDEGLLQTESDWMKFMPMWEEYVEDPEETAEEDLLTFIYVPLSHEQ